MMNTSIVGVGLGAGLLALCSLFVTGLTAVTCQTMTMERAAVMFGLLFAALLVVLVFAVVLNEVQA